MNSPEDSDITENAIPDLAHAVVRSVLIPTIPLAERKEYIRPDTFRVYIPQSEQYDSDEEEERNDSFATLVEHYKKKSIIEVKSKQKNNTGRVNYNVMFGGPDKIQESVPWRILHSHPDWSKIEEFEYNSVLAEERET